MEQGVVDGGGPSLRISSLPPRPGRMVSATITTAAMNPQALTTHALQLLFRACGLQALAVVELLDQLQWVSPASLAAPIPHVLDAPSILPLAKYHVVL